MIPSNNIDLEKVLNELPDQVADHLYQWRVATLDKEKLEAKLYLQFKGQDKDRSATEIKAMIHADGSRYLAILNEINKETDYNRFYERLMAQKKLADLRTAF